MGYNYLVPSSIIPIILITFSLLIIPVAFSIIEDTELDYNCLSSSKEFTISYDQSRALVVMNLIRTTGSHDGFRNASYTWFQNGSSTLDDPNEWAYGLAQCRGDVSPDNCTKCVNNASTALVYTRCPYSRAAIIWRDYCVFKYSDVEFFGKIDTDNKLIKTSERSSLAPSWAAIKLLRNLNQTAIESPMLFASGSLSGELYAMAQCTRDLSANSCSTCLGQALTDLSNCCFGKEGVRVFCGSCNVRYETYNFLTN